MLQIKGLLHDNHLSHTKSFQFYPKIFLTKKKKTRKTRKLSDVNKNNRCLKHIFKLSLQTPKLKSSWKHWGLKAHQLIAVFLRHKKYKSFHYHTLTASVSERLLKSKILRIHVKAISFWSKPDIPVPNLIKVHKVKLKSSWVIITVHIESKYFSFYVSILLWYCFDTNRALMNWLELIMKETSSLTGFYSIISNLLAVSCQFDLNPVLSQTFIKTCSESQSKIIQEDVKAFESFKKVYSSLTQALIEKFTTNLNQRQQQIPTETCLKKQWIN